MLAAVPGEAQVAKGSPSAESASATTTSASFSTSMIRRTPPAADSFVDDERSTRKAAATSRRRGIERWYTRSGSSPEARIATLASTTRSMSISSPSGIPRARAVPSGRSASNCFRTRAISGRSRARTWSTAAREPPRSRCSRTIVHAGL